MTIAFALLNDQGVVLAADPFVANAAGVERTRQHKVFELSPKHPIALMIYDHDTFYGIPMNTIIQLYREQMNAVYYDHATSYLQGFLNFIETDLFDKFDLAAREAQFIRELITAKLDNLHQLLTYVADVKMPEEGLRTDAEIKAGLLERGDNLFAYELQNLEKQVHLDAFSGDDELEVFRQYEDEIIHYVQTHFPTYKDDWLYKVATIVVQHVLKTLSDKQIGVVVAGYGEKDLSPSVCRITIDGRVIGKLRTGNYVAVKSSAEQPAYPVAFTDTTRLSQLMQGISQDMEMGFLTALRQHISPHVRPLLDKVQAMVPDQPDLQARFAQTVLSCQYQLKNEIDQMKNEQFSQPFIEMLTDRSVDELTYIAERLLHGELFGTDMTAAMDQEAVRQNIASITKAHHVRQGSRDDQTNRGIVQ